MARKLANEGRVSDIEQLVGCISSSGLPEFSEISDEILMISIQVINSQQEPKELKVLVKLISDEEKKVTMSDSFFYLYKYRTTYCYDWLFYLI